MTKGSRPVTVGRAGAVASPHHSATLAGIRVLDAGGTAIDAAIAVNAVLGVVYPHMTGIGGDAFWLVYEGASGRVHALNGSGRCAARADPQLFGGRGLDAVPATGPLAAITVPGAVDSWFTAHERFGRLPMGDLIEHAVRLARDGVPVTRGLAGFVAGEVDTLRKSPGLSRLFLPGGHIVTEGDVVPMGELAATLEMVARDGRDAFYRGALAAAIGEAVTAAGGVMAAEDLGAHSSTWTEPISTTYRGLTCYQHPPNSQGIVHLMALNLLEGFDLPGTGPESAEYVHLCVEAAKLAYADRDRYLADPDHASVPTAHLLSKVYADELRERMSPGLAAAPVSPRDPFGDTTCTVVVDREGTAATVIQSLCHAFGSGFVAGDTGVLLHNRGAKFSLNAGHPNVLRPGKRPAHTLMPGLLCRDGELLLAYGTMGGDGQPQTNTALVTRVVDFGLDVQAAIDAPRWLYGQFWGERSNDLWVERGVGDGTVERLERFGQPVRVVEDRADIMGHAQAIQVDKARGVVLAGSDPRGDGCALAQ